MGVLKHRTYLLLWLSQALSDLSEWLVFFALSLLLFQLTGSGMSVAVLRACHAVPMLVLGPLGGVLVDRWDERWIMAGSAGLRALLVLALMPLKLPLVIYVVVLALNVLLVVFDPARASLLPGVVPEGRLAPANSLMSVTKTVTLLFGAAVGGILVTQAGIAETLLVAFGLLAVAALAPLGVVRERPIRAPGAVMTDLAKGLKYAIDRPVVWGAILLESLLLLSIGTYQLLAVVYAERYLTGAEAYSQLLMSLGIGATVGMMVSGTLSASLGSLPVLVIGMGLAASAMLWLGVRVDLWWGSVGYVGIGAAGLLVDVSVTTLLQLAVPAGMRGRVFGLRHTLVHVAVLAGNGLAGFLADDVDLKLVFLGAGTLGSILSLVSVALWRGKLNGPGKAAATFPESGSS